MLIVQSIVIHVLAKKKSAFGKWIQEQNHFLQKRCKKQDRKIQSERSRWTNAFFHSCVVPTTAVKDGRYKMTMSMSFHGKTTGHPFCCLLCAATRSMQHRKSYEVKNQAYKLLNFHLLEPPELWGEKRFHEGKMKGCRCGWALKLWDYAFALFVDKHTHTQTHSTGPLGPKEISVCGFFQPPVPVLMMASTCCFNVTAGSPSIPHWLWLPSAAGSSPLHPPPSISSAISASSVSFHFHLLILLPLIPVLPPPIHLLTNSLLKPSCRTKSHIALPQLPSTSLLHFFPSFPFSSILSVYSLMFFSVTLSSLYVGKWPTKQQDYGIIVS